MEGLRSCRWTAQRACACSGGSKDFFHPRMEPGAKRLKLGHPALADPFRSKGAEPYQMPMLVLKRSATQPPREILVDPAPDNRREGIAHPLYNLVEVTEIDVREVICGIEFV